MTMKEVKQLIDADIEYIETEQRLMDKDERELSREFVRGLRQAMEYMHEKKEEDIKEVDG